MPKKKAPSTGEAKQKELAKRYAQFVAKVWADEGLRERLMSDPAPVLREAGFSLPEDKDVKIIELDMKKNFYFIVPTKSAEPFSDIQLESMVRPPFSAHDCMGRWS